MTEKINIKNVAKLAALKLTSEEEQKLEKDLSMIIDHFAALSEMELPEKGFVFCCFNNSYKISLKEFILENKTSNFSSKNFLDIRLITFLSIN